MNYRISLVMATVNRKIEVEKMLQSLSKQIYTNFEVIIIDQNKENILKEIIKNFSDLDIKHVRINKRGLSLARNVGLNYVSGDIIGFPDDDCQYKKETLDEVNKFFKENVNIGAVTGTVIRDMNKKVGDKIVFVDKYNIWKRGISFTMFFRRNVIDKIGKFDEMLGVGSGTPFGSGEETDYMLRIIENKILLCNTNKILVYHPEEKWDDENIHKKVYSYAKGYMYVLRKHNYGLLYIFASRCFSVLKMLRYIYNKQKRKRFWYEFLGKL